MVAVNAAPTAPSSFVGDTPERILDTRTDVGLTGPFVTGVAQTLQVTGTVATQPSGTPTPPAVNKVVVPTGATAVVLNVTVVGPSTPGFISIRPGDATGVPATSNINWGAGGPNIANSVTVQLPATGTINIYVQGTVREVLIDVAGYYQAGGGTPGPAGPAGPAGPPGPVTAQIVPINFRGTTATNAPLVTLNGITVQLDCAGSSETIEVTTTKTGGEISAVSHDASFPDLAPHGAFDDNFSAGDTFVAGPGAGNVASDRQYMIAYAAPDGKNVNVELTTEDSIGADNCVVSGFAIGAPA
jgi:hypothetical protein